MEGVRTSGLKDVSIECSSWNRLVFDDMGRDAISSVMRVNDLRSYGVTIHL